jgi:hypothetical protein
VVIATGAPATPHSSVGPRPSASPDVAAIIEASAAQFSATIRLLNLADSDIAVSVAFIDPSTPQPQDLGTYTVGASGQESDSVPPGTYRLAFKQPLGASAGSTCTIAIAKGGVVTFVAVPGAIAVSRTGYAPTKSADLFVPTSSLCGK